LLLAEEKAQLQKSVENASGVPTETQEELVRAITNLAIKINGLADSLEQK
jgi:hypothetical protein